VTALGGDLRARLARLDFVLRRSLPGTLRGDRRAPRRKGISLEFADFRAYAPGDDVRHLDWASLARLDQLLIRLYHDEEELNLNLVVDMSRSMAYGTPPKRDLAIGLAAALAWIGRVRGHRVEAWLLGDDLEHARPGASTGAFEAFLDRLETMPATSTRPLIENLDQLRLRTRLRGLTVLISDLFEPAGPRPVLKRLMGPRRSLNLLQVLAPEELEPDLEGDLLLEDMETGEAVEITWTPPLAEIYRRRLAGHLATWAETARRRGAGWIHLNSRLSLEDAVLNELAPKGWLA